MSGSFLKMYILFGIITLLAVPIRVLAQGVPAPEKHKPVAVQPPFVKNEKPTPKNVQEIAVKAGNTANTAQQTANTAQQTATDALKAAGGDAALKTDGGALKAATDALKAAGGDAALKTDGGALKAATDALKAAGGDAALKTDGGALKVAKQAQNTADAATAQNVNTKAFVDRFWVLTAAVLVFFMQAGFLCLEVGCARKTHRATVGIMNLMNWLVLCLAFYLAGYGLMFGSNLVKVPVVVQGETTERVRGLHIDRWGGWAGSILNPPPTNHIVLYTHEYKIKERTEETPLGIEYFLFQLAFAATTATIVDGAIAERTWLPAYLIVTFGVAVLMYPIFGHWAWNDKGWLNMMGFHDFAGSTVVHSVGAWIALAGVYSVGNRLNRFTDSEKTDSEKREQVRQLLLTRFAQCLSLLLVFPLFWSPKKTLEEAQAATKGKEKTFKAEDLGFAVLGVIMLWFGWWGFNGGSLLRYDQSMANLILHTNLAGASAGIIAFLHALAQRDTSNLYSKTIGGALGGLVAITASCDVVTPVQAILIGIVAGFIHNLAYDFLLSSRIDDMAGAIPVHGPCGVWGTFMAGIAYSYSKHHTPEGYLRQIGVQVSGIIIAFVYTIAIAGFVFCVLKNTIGLRTSAQEEQNGI